MTKLIIKEIAKSQGLNQSQLQLKAGVSAQLLNRYWNNYTRSIALDQIGKIAKALNVEPGELLASEEAIMRGGMKRWQNLHTHDVGET